MIPRDSAKSYSDTEKYWKGMKNLNYAYNELLQKHPDYDYVQTSVSIGISLLSELRHTYEDEEKDPAFEDDSPGTRYHTPG